MEDLTALSAATLLKRNQSLELAVIRYGDPDVERKWADVKAELDRRCTEVFEWKDDQLHIKAKNSFVGVHQTMWTDVVGCHWSDIDYFPIENPADFSALLSYFISKPKP